MFGGTAANVRSFFRGRTFLKLFKSLTVGQAVPEIPVSVGSKLELLLRDFVFCLMSVYFPVHSRICPRMHIAVYIYIRVCYYTLYMTEAPRICTLVPSLYYFCFIHPYIHAVE